MRFFLLMLVGIAAYGGAFVKLGVAGVQVIYICILCLFLSYLFYFVKMGRKVNLTSVDKILLIFFVFGIIRFALSLFGITDRLISSELYINKLYAFRQAYFLFFIPAITVLSNTKYINAFRELVRQHHFVVFMSVYIINIVINRQFAIGVPTTLFLAYLVLDCEQRDAWKWIFGFVVMFTPIAVGGELTNLIIRLIFAAYFLFGTKLKTKVNSIMSFSVWTGIALTFILPMFVPLVSGILDANSFWRLLYWHDELVQLVHSNLIGVGFGTSFASTNFVGEVGSASGPFAATAEYSTLDKLFVTGPHNSFIAVAFRLGIVGIILLILSLKKLDKELKQYSTSDSAMFLFFSALSIVSTNVGLESPYYLAFFVFSVAMGLYEVKEILGYNNFETVKRKHRQRGVRITFGNRRYTTAKTSRL